MKLSKNNISKFERIIEEEWNLLQEQIAPNMGMKITDKDLAKPLVPSYTSKPRTTGLQNRPYSSKEEEIYDKYLLPEPSGMKSAANHIKNMSAKESDDWLKFIDDEKSAFNSIIRLTPTIRHYFWLNRRICEATGYNSCIEFLMSFSERRFGSEASLEDWIKTISYRENMDLAKVEIEKKDWKNLLEHLEKLKNSNTEVWEKATYFEDSYPAHGKQGKSVQEQSSDWYNMASDSDYVDVTGGVTPGSGVDADYLTTAPGTNWGVGPEEYQPKKLNLKPIRDHIELITGKQLVLSKKKEEIAKKKEWSIRIGKSNGFVVPQWFRDYIDEDPAEALQFTAGIVSMGSGLLAWSIATGLSATGTAINIENKEYGEAGNNAFWTAFFGLGAIKNIPAVRRLTNAGKLKIIEGFTTSKWEGLNQITSKAFADITKYVNSPGGQAAVARITSRQAAAAYNRASNVAKMSGPGRVLNNIINGGKNSFGRLLGFIDNTKYITVPGYLGWNWYANWWPEIYYNTPEFVDVEDVKIYEDLEDDGDVMFDPVFDEQGTYIGPNPNEYN